MTRLRKIVIAGVLLLCSATLSYGGTITGSRTGASGSKVGTITGSRTGTITGSRVGTITGSRMGTITGSAVRSSQNSVDNIYSEFLFRLMSVVLNGGF
jgi:outer membrane lipoprotein SlyB